ncbi:hypothetical protein HMPREF1548_04041 [Clostridium sp. KLE 1755]|nr:hypothetical protein HMPREF1548_04041 [Clostridium sp. KLE 1755]
MPGLNSVVFITFPPACFSCVSLSRRELFSQQHYNPIFSCCILSEDKYSFLYRAITPAAL